MSSRAGSAANLVDYLARAALYPEAGLRLLDRRERERWLPWAEVRERALAACGRLQAAGIAPGDRLALLFPTSDGFLDALFGALLAGATPAPLYPPPRFGRIEEYRRRTGAMLRRLRPALALCDPRYERRLGGALDGTACRSLASLPEGRAEAASPSPADLALIQFSSGTTADPKPVALSHRAILTQAVALNAYWPEARGERQEGLSWLPLYHDMGLIGCIFTALERPGRVTLIPPEVFAARPAIWLRSISRFGATISAAPNFAYGHCLEGIAEGELEGVDLSRWRVALNGAEPVSPRVMRRFAERFGPYGFRAEALTPVYGLAEATLAVTFSDPARPFVSRRFDREALSWAGRAVPDREGVEIASVGRPLEGFQISVRGAAGRELGERRVGRIWVRGPSLMEGYLGRPGATRRVIRGGWLDTGDRGFLDGGELFLTGRAKDLVILRGRNYAPEVIEGAVHGMPGVRSGGVAAVGHLPEGGAREQLLLFVERARARCRLPEIDLLERCRREVLARTGLAVDRLLLLGPDTLPRTSSGKVRRGETLRRFLAGELAGETA